MRRTIELPLLRDHHSHVSLYAALGGCPSILGLSKEQALKLLRALPPDRLSIALGWYSATLSFSRDELAGLPPVVILNNSLHGMLLSDRAQELLRPTDPELVEMHADVEWCERHLAEVLTLYSRLASPSAEKIAALLGRLEAVGVGWAEDMLILDERSLGVMGKDVLCWADPGIWQGMGREGRGRVHGFKLFLDGALAMRTAALSEPYLQGGDGLLIYSDQALQEKLAGLAPLGKPVAIHAIGGRAISQALGVLEGLDRDGLTLPAVRLEHVQFIDEPQARRAKELGLSLCMQPNFSVESRDYADRLPKSHLCRLNPFRMLIDRAGFRPGGDLLLGSDGMPHGAEAAWQWGLFPMHEIQHLSSEELAAGYGPAVPGGKAIRLLVDEDSRQVKRA